jgi:hypothetical protein
LSFYDIIKGCESEFKDGWVILMLSYEKIEIMWRNVLKDISWQRKNRKNKNNMKTKELL